VLRLALSTEVSVAFRGLPWFTSLLLWLIRGFRGASVVGFRPLILPSVASVAAVVWFQPLIRLSVISVVKGRSPLR
jgi:hypothetical protein